MKYLKKIKIKINDQDQSKYNELKKIIKYLNLYRAREKRMGSTPKERRIIVSKKMKEFNENNNYSNNDSIPRVMIINENFMEATSFLGCQSVLFISPPISYDQYLQYKGRCLRACASHIQIHFKEQQKIEFLIYVSTFDVNPNIVETIYKNFENVVDTRKPDYKMSDYKYRAVFA